VNNVYKFRFQDVGSIPTASNIMLRMEDIMKIEGVNTIPHTNIIRSGEVAAEPRKEFASIVKIHEAGTQGVNLPKNTNKDLVQDFAEWYFKQGKTLETTKSYKQAISAYEKANSADPDINKSQSINQVRKKAYDK
jgi:hypothetical protein